MDRRHFVRRASGMLAATALGAGAGVGARAAALSRVAVAVPGPGNLLFLPLTLAGRIGADQAEGLELDLHYKSGGPQAFHDLLERNTDFAAGGLAALALQRINGQPVQCVAPLTRVPAYTLLVGIGHRAKVRRIADLAGKVIGVKGQSAGGRSTTQLFTEFVLAKAGVATDQVNYVPVGQSFDSQHAALASATVDAIMGDEPFATRLVSEKVAFALADYHDLQTTRSQLGGLFLNGHVATRDDVVRQRPDLVDKLVKTVKRTLVWIEQHPAQDLLDALVLDDAQERRFMLEVLKRRKTIYSPDGRFSGEQVASVQRFLRATEDSDAARKFNLMSMINTQWAGSAS